jgi:hypothetical protein
MQDAWKEREIHTRIAMENPKGRDDLADQGTDGRIREY